MKFNLKRKDIKERCHGNYTLCYQRELPVGTLIGLGKSFISPLRDIPDQLSIESAIKCILTIVER